MKYLLLYPIRVYQAFFPKRYRGKCLFKESCSKYEYRITNEEGFFKGLRALKYRVDNCRGNYIVSCVDNKKILITGRYKIIEAKFIRKEILKEF